MAVEGGRYLREQTAETLRELRRFCMWHSRNLGGSWPVVIGGWAVWSYHGAGLGSRDVDLLFPSAGWIRMVVESYFPGSGFRKHRAGDPVFGELCYGKPTPSGDVIIFDMTSAEEPREDPDGMGVGVDWNWVYDGIRPAPIGGGASINVPGLEVLITLKMIGCISRSRRFRRSAEKAYARSKIWKDCYDIGNLATHLDPDPGRLSECFARTGMSRDLVRELLETCDAYGGAFREGGSEIGSVEALLGLSGR